MKKGSAKLPRSVRSKGSVSRNRGAPGSALDLAGVETTRTHLHLDDLPFRTNDAGDLKVWLPGTTRLVVRVRNIVAEGDALVADVAAAAIDGHGYSSTSSMRAMSAPSPLRCLVLRMRV